MLADREEQVKLLRGFWDRWSREYLPLIATRKKWSRKTEPLRKDDLVFLCEPTGWVRGRVKEVFMDPETQQTREAVVISGSREYRRPTSRLAKIKIL